MQWRVYWGGEVWGKSGEEEVYHGCGSSQSCGFELISFTRPSEVQAASALPGVGIHVTCLGKPQSGRCRHTLPTCENATVKARGSGYGGCHVLPSMCGLSYESELPFFCLLCASVNVVTPAFLCLLRKARAWSGASSAHWRKEPPVNVVESL